MSNTTSYTIDTTVFDQAMSDAIDRFSEHWSTMNWNMWEEYNTTLNSTWWDPWYENDTRGIFNGPSTGDGDPAYEMTQNAFGVWNWYCLKGYSEYAIAALLTAHTQESTITGGLWESGIHPYPGQAPTTYLGGNYGSLVGYNATRTGQNPYNYTWYLTGGTAAPGYTLSVVDPIDGLTYTKTAEPGSWDAILHYTALIPPSLSTSGQVEWDPASSQPLGGIGRGYGLVQWTPWNVLVAVAGDLTGELFNDTSIGQRHWQLNLTLQLMVLEYERSLAMDPQQDQSSPDYKGQWMDSLATNASIVKRIDGVDRTIRYPVSCTWDFWASDGPIAYFKSYIESLGGTFTDWDAIRSMMDIFRVCYLHTGAADFGFEEKSAYWLAAIRYWGSHGGYNPAYIPRARDLPHTELDKYHITPELLPAISSRRRRKPGVRTVLFRQVVNHR